MIDGVVESVSDGEEEEGGGEAVQGKVERVSKGEVGEGGREAIYRVVEVKTFKKKKKNQTLKLFCFSSSFSLLPEFVPPRFSGQHALNIFGNTRILEFGDYP